jgi:TusE/DsrC/DsvC family sulfur relay protein
MPAIEYKGKTINVDSEGYLENVDDWDESVANALADKEGLAPLSEDQIDALEFMRQYYHKYNFFPIVNAVCKNVHQPADCVSHEFIDPVIAWKIAGLPKPDDEVISYLER